MTTVKSKVHVITVECAYEVINELGGSEKIETDGLLVCSGEHAVYGRVYVVIPPLGDSVVLPFAFQPES